MNKVEYLLICLMEEAAEVQRIASKCLRFGLKNYHPDHPETTNIQELFRETVDFDAARSLLIDECVLPDIQPSIRTMTPKIEKIKYFMQVSENCGTLQRQPEAEEGE